MGEDSQMHSPTLLHDQYATCYGTSIDTRRSRAAACMQKQIEDDRQSSHIITTLAILATAGVGGGGDSSLWADILIVLASYVVATSSVRPASESRWHIIRDDGRGRDLAGAGGRQMLLIERKNRRPAGRPTAFPPRWAYIIAYLAPEMELIMRPAGARQEKGAVTPCSQPGKETAPIFFLACMLFPAGRFYAYVRAGRSQSDMPSESVQYFFAFSAQWEKNENKPAGREPTTRTSTRATEAKSPPPSSSFHGSGSGIDAAAGEPTAG